MNRGSTVHHVESIPLDWASMRPRFMNRGSSVSRASCGDTGCCFNEAPIHESGKWTVRAERSGRSAGFNEAPIHESGK